MHRGLRADIGIILRAQRDRNIIIKDRKITAMQIHTCCKPRVTYTSSVKRVNDSDADMHRLRA
jgi:hypothetical protein